MALQPQVLRTRPSFVATRSCVESLSLKGNAYKLRVPVGEKGVSRWTLQRRRQEVLVQPIFLFLHMYVRYAGMCISTRLHMCLRVYKNPKLARGVLLVCSLSYILR